jgi:hypothetical protein
MKTAMLLLSLCVIAGCDDTSPAPVAATSSKPYCVTEFDPVSHQLVSSEYNDYCVHSPNADQESAKADAEMAAWRATLPSCTKANAFSANRTCNETPAQIAAQDAENAAETKRKWTPKKIAHWVQDEDSVAGNSREAWILPGHRDDDECGTVGYVAMFHDGYDASFGEPLHEMHSIPTRHLAETIVVAACGTK